MGVEKEVAGEGEKTLVGVNIELRFVLLRAVAGLE